LSDPDCRTIRTPPAASSGRRTVILEVSRQGGERADAQGPAARLRRPAQRADELIAGREDRIGIVQSHPSSLGQGERAPFPLEQIMAELGFQLANLHGQGGLGQVERLSRAGQTALMGHRPEIPQMFVIHSDHISI
jgi:hypothetical protein